MAATLRNSLKGKQAHVAVCMGTSEPTISRLLSDDRTEQLCLLMAFGGFKLVAVDDDCYPRGDVEAMFRLAKGRLAAADSLDDLMGGSE